MYWNFEQDPDRNLIIAGVPAITNQLEVPLTLDIDTDKNVVIMIDEKRNINRKVFLHDKILNTYHDLEENLELDLPRGNYKNRFFLVFGENALSTTDEEVIDNGFQVFIDQDNREMVLRTNDDIQVEKVVLYNILGKELVSWKGSQIEFEAGQTRLQLIDYPSGIYFVNVQTSKGTYRKKVYVGFD